MTPKDIIRLNNEKRKQLSKDNLTYYEDMLVYIRLNAQKSEVKTEEILLELLEHLLQAQTEGKTAEEVFGSNPEEYCQELISELPNEKRTLQVTFIIYIALQFLAIIALTNGVIGFILNYFFDLGSNNITFSLGSWIVIIILYLLIGFIFIVAVLRWLKRSAFKVKLKEKRWLGFLKMWLVCFGLMSLFVIIPFIMPDFGTTLSMPILSLVVIGIILYLASFILNKKMKKTKA